jgi:hypothetical protein
MNYIKHLTGFFNRIAIENSLNPTHISLYLTLFQCWNINRFKNPITISRDEMMKGSKIASKATYHKCIKELQRLGFLDYQPSYNPYSGTLVFVHNLSEGYKEKTNTEPAKPKNEQVNSKATEQVDGLPHIYNNKQTFKNNKNIDIEPEFLIFNEMPFAFADTEKKQTEESRHNSFLENQAEDQKEKSSAKKEKVVNPSIELVKEYFLFQESSEFEAERFFNYYSSNGWLIGGKTKMKDWKASARNWMLNTSKFTINTPQANPAKEQPRAYNLHTVTDKNYAEPL